MIDRDEISRSFHHFIHSLREAVSQGGTPEIVSRRVRTLMLHALRDDSFRLACILETLPVLDDWLVRGVDPIIFDDDRLEVSIKVILWPSGSSSAPHEHTHWTVTGVLHNALTFSTFHADDNESWVPQREYEGRQADVGYIASRCIHSVANRTARGSLSLHVFSGAKRSLVTPDGHTRSERGNTRWFSSRTHDSTRAPIHGRHGFTTLFALLRSISSKTALGLIEEICSTRDRFVKLDGAKALSDVDPCRASAILHLLALDCSAPEASSLRALARRLEATASQI